MVCIAAFIILALVGVVVAFLSIFKREIGKKYLAVFKKAWHCVFKKVRLQKCETGFKDDVKNTLLSRVIVKHPKWVKPISAIIEVLSVVIVIIAIWAILTAIKSLLALWALGSCNVTTPSACSFGAEMCSIDESEPQNPIEATGRWFTEWGEIFEAIPDKFRTYNADDYHFSYININSELSEDKPVAVDIFDPGCSVCMISYRNQKTSGFFDKYNVRLVPFAIMATDSSYKFNNSGVVVKYMLAVEQLHSGMAIKLIDHIFTEKDSNGRSYQDLFNDDYSREEAVAQIEKWLKHDGLDDGAIKEVRTVANYPEIVDKMNENQNIVENELRAKGIPTMIYDGKRHTGLYKAD